MASNTFSLDVAEKQLDEEGFLDLNDMSVGQPISEMEQQGFRFYSEFGLDFGKTQILDDERIRSILKSVLGKCVLVHWLRYTEYPGHITLFRRGGPQAGRQCLLVHLLGKGSQMSYRRGSHLHDLPTIEGNRSLHETSAHAYDEAGCEAKIISFQNGGKVILDARVGWEIKKGYAITFEFAKSDIARKWTKMLLLNSYLMHKVRDMQSEEIGLNFAFQSSSTTKLRDQSPKE